MKTPAILLETVITTIVNFSQKQRSPLFKLIVMLLGSANLLVIFPFLFIPMGLALAGYLVVPCPRSLQIVIAILSLLAGLSLLLWSVVTQIRIGKGTPVPFAPTRNLIITGPYKWCRNPIHLGAMIFYLGAGTWWGSLTVGITSFLLGLIILGTYNKLVEEKELRLRFGREYEDYKKKTPFLIPRPWRTPRSSKQDKD